MICMKEKLKALLIETLFYQKWSKCTKLMSWGLVRKSEISKFMFNQFSSLVSKFLIVRKLKQELKGIILNTVDNQQ